MIKQILTRKIYEPIYFKYYRRVKTLKSYREFERAQWNSIDENKKIQGDKLYELVKYAAEKIPYYRRIVRQNKITLSRDTIFDDIAKFPVLTKQIIRENFADLQYLDLNVKWFYNTSGGSTGEPVRFVQDRNFEAECEAINRLQYNWVGYKSGEQMILLWGSARDTLHQKTEFKHRFANWMKSVEILDSFRMDEDLMRRYVNIINKKKPVIILAFAQSIHELAKFIKKNSLQVHSPSAIMTSANTLSENERKTIQDVFRCSVVNRYGSREVGNMACECPMHEGLHISVFTHYLEILNDRLEPCREGELGEIYVTLLTNFTMPLIRYKIGDVAVFTGKKCSCRRGLPVIREVTGRNNDLFITKKGEKIHTGIFNSMFYFKDWAEKYQIVQKKPDVVEIRVVLSQEAQKFDIENEYCELKANMRKILGEDCTITINAVKKIEPAKSGKYRYTIREF